jgi:RNA polymerase sigma-70 factor (ECF subfamily)
VDDIALTLTGARAVESAPEFEEFFEAKRDRLYRALYLLTGNRHEAEELTQDAFLKVWERWDRVAAMERPEGYLFRAAMNLFRSRLRRARVAARRTLGRAEARDELAEVVQRDAVLRALASLTPRQRAALVLTELLDLETNETAEMLGVSPGTVRSLCHQGRAALRTTMETNDE